MKKQLLDELGKAAYEARKAAMITGAYSDHAIHIPDSEHFYEWDEIPDRLKDPAQWLYRRESEGVLDTFFMYVFANGSAEAMKAMETLLRETRDILLTDEERAVAEGGGRQR